MRTYIYSLITHIKEYKRLYLAVIFLLVLGIACGARSAVKLDIQRSLQWGDALGGTLSAEQGGAFLRALFREARIFLLLSLCALGMVGIPAAGLLVTIRGFLLGFSLGFLIGNYGVGGFWIAMGAVIPQNILFIMAILYAAAIAIRASSTRRLGKQYWLRIGAAFLASVIGVAAEALLSALLPMAAGV